MIEISAINLGHEITVTAEDPEAASVIIRQLITTGWCICAHQTVSDKAEERKAWQDSAI